MYNKNYPTKSLNILTKIILCVKHSYLCTTVWKKNHPRLWYLILYTFRTSGLSARLIASPWSFAWKECYHVFAFKTTMLYLNRRILRRVYALLLSSGGFHKDPLSWDNARFVNAAPVVFDFFWRLEEIFLMVENYNTSYNCGNVLQKCSIYRICILYVTAISKVSYGSLVLSFFYL